MTQASASPGIGIPESTTIEARQQTPTDFQLPIHNWEALAQLRKEKDFLATQTLAVGSAACAAGTFFALVFYYLHWHIQLWLID